MKTFKNSGIYKGYDGEKHVYYQVESRTSGFVYFLDLQTGEELDGRGVYIEGGIECCYPYGKDILNPIMLRASLEATNKELKEAGLRPLSGNPTQAKETTEKLVSKIHKLIKEYQARESFNLSSIKLLEGKLNKEEDEKKDLAVLRNKNILIQQIKSDLDSLLDFV